MASSEEKVRVVIVHYHLRLGGVTRVIHSARDALVRSGFDVLILSGESSRDGENYENVRVVDALRYRKAGSSVVASSLTEAIKREALDYFGEEPDVWHFHNPTLAKNVLIPNVVRELAEGGGRVVLQLHDFAEDGRPGNYSSQRSFFDSEESFEKTLYPVASQIHYVTINYRDCDFLKAAGVKWKNLHVVPNAIRPLQVTTRPNDRPFSEKKLLALYPTRGIRRKNLGELLLLALIYGDRIDFATTLSPENPDWLKVHQGWVEAVEELELPVKLGIADDGDYAFLDLVGWSDFIVTTSIAEGFGLAFLEPWTASKPVLGRDLPEITRDFESNGLHLKNLYSRIEVPVEWIGEARIREAIESMLRRSYLAYDVSIPKNSVKNTWKAWVKKGKIDFGVLDEVFQLEILRRLKSDLNLIDEVSIPTLDLSTGGEIAVRKKLIGEVYGPEAYVEQMRVLYAKVLQSSIGKVSHLATDRVLEQFLDPSRLNLLRD